MRVMIWLILALIVYLAIKSKARRMQENMRNAVKAEFEAQAANQDQAQQTQARQPRNSVPVENMVACAHCQIYLPASEAVHLTTPDSELFFCSEAHLRLHSSQSGPSNQSSVHE